MKKSTVTVFFCVFAFAVGGAQNLWRLEAPGFTSTFPWLQLSISADRYVLNTGNTMFHFDESGTIRGAFDGDFLGAQSQRFLSYVSVKTDKMKGQPFIWIVARNINTHAGYKLIENYPHNNEIHQQVFSDSLTQISKHSPLVLEWDDSTLIVFGLKYLRSITRKSVGEFVVNWEQINTTQTHYLTAVRSGDRIVAAPEKGGLTGFDSGGNLLWNQQNILIINDIKETPSGFVVCSKDVNNSGFGITDKDGTLLSFWIYPEYKMNAIVALPDGGYAATGNDLSENIILFLADGNGIAKQVIQFDKGVGRGILKTLGNDGLVIAARMKTGSKIQLIKTDFNGKTAGETVKAQIRERTLRSAGLDVDFHPRASLFFDGNGTPVKFKEPSAAEILTITVPWIAGQDSAGALYLAAEGFYNSEMRTGHVHTAAADFNRVWSVDRSEIEALRLDFGDNGKLDRPAPFDLLTWPGKWNPHFTHNLDFSKLQTPGNLFPAPFVDHNNDGVYNIFDGDYPDILGDQMLWWAMSDDTTHQNSEGIPGLFDLTFMPYAYRCDQNEGVKNSVFVRINYQNKSNISYKNARFGIHTASSLSCNQEDYKGTIPDLDATYLYNKDTHTDICGNTAGKELYFPTEVISLLNRSLDRVIYFNRTGTAGPAATWDPVVPIEFYHYLDGKWRDGSPFTSGGSGYNPSNPNAVPANYMFPDNPADPQGWSMCTAQLPWGDRRIVGAHFLDEWPANAKYSIDLAFSFLSPLPEACADIQPQLVPVISELKQNYEDGAFSLGHQMDEVYQLPAGGQINLNAAVPNGTYLWSGGETTSSIAVSAPGIYEVTVTGSTGCTAKEQVLVVPAASGVRAPYSFDMDWKLFPQPVQGFARIVCPSCTDAPVRFDILDTQGRILSVQTLTGGWNSTLDCSELPPGMYMVRLYGADAYFGVRKLIKG